MTKITQSVMTSVTLDDGRKINLLINKEGIKVSGIMKKANAKLTLSLGSWKEIEEHFNDYEKRKLGKTNGEITMKCEWEKLQRTEAIDVISRYINHRNLRKWNVIYLGDEKYRIINCMRGVNKIFDMKVKKEVAQ